MDKLANEGVSVSSTAVKKEQAKTQIPAALVNFLFFELVKSFCFRQNQFTSASKRKSNWRRTETAA